MATPVLCNSTSINVQKWLSTMQKCCRAKAIDRTVFDRDSCYCSKLVLEGFLYKSQNNCCLAIVGSILVIYLARTGTSKKYTIAGLLETKDILMTNKKTGSTTLVSSNTIFFSI